MALWFRVAFAIWLVLVSALSLSLFLNHAKFDSTYADISRSRFRVLAQDVKASVESGLALGLGMGELRNTQQIVERTKADAAEIRAVTVADARGAILFDSASVTEGATLPATQVGAILALASVDGMWAGVEGGDALIGLPILNPFQVPVGLVVLRYDGASLAAVQDKALNEMLESMLIIIAGITIVTAPLVMWTFAGVRRTFRNMLATAGTTLPPDVLAAREAEAVVEEARTPAAEVGHIDAELPAPSAANEPEAEPQMAEDSLEAEFGAFARTAAGTLERIRAAQSR